MEISGRSGRLNAEGGIEILTEVKLIRERGRRERTVEIVVEV